MAAFFVSSYGSSAASDVTYQLGQQDDATSIQVSLALHIQHSGYSVVAIEGIMVQDSKSMPVKGGDGPSGVKRHILSALIL